jgi:hypothetical protein
VLHVDLVSAYCLCGASALVAAGLMLLAKVDDPEHVRAIRGSPQRSGAPSAWAARAPRRP